MSLWPVSDFATRDLMIEYYRRLQRGEGRTEALRNVQLKMLKQKTIGSDEARGIKLGGGRQERAEEGGRKKDYSHPYYWASFIQSGEWKKLD